jgi:predicted site-specific integrase-resolvase
MLAVTTPNYFIDDIRKTVDFRIDREQGGLEGKTCMKKKRVAIYLRVSTSKQDTENQLRG